MLCESCGKNKANLHYTKVVDGKIEEKHLCDKCAAENYDFDFDKPFSMSKIFTGLIDGIQEYQNEGMDLRCSNCGLSYEEFRREGKFGCSQCYETFKNKLDPLIKGLHGHDIHRGKIPKNANGEVFLRREEKNLKVKLENAIKMEEFEEAAIIRDELKMLKDRIDGYKGG